MPKRLWVIIILFILIIGALGGVFYLYLKSRLNINSKSPENSEVWTDMRPSPPKEFFTGKVLSFNSADKSVSVVSSDNIQVNATIKCTKDVTVLNEITLSSGSITDRPFSNKFTTGIDMFSVIREGDDITFGCKDENCKEAIGLCTLTRKNNEELE
jgi:hypothetical protein